MVASPSTTRADPDSWAVDRAVSLIEVWALVAAFNGLVGAWQLLGVCRAARAGVKEFLETLPRLVVCGGYVRGDWETVSEQVWGLDLATMRWEAMPVFMCARSSSACCAVRDALVVLGGLASSQTRGIAPTSRLEMLSRGEGAAFVELPPLSCGAISGAAAIVVDESHSALGQVLLLGGIDQDYTSTSSVRLVDLATGVCTPQADLPRSHALVFCGSTIARYEHRLCRRRRCTVDGGSVAAAGAGRARCGMDLEGAVRHECRAPSLQWMRAERRPLRCPRRPQQFGAYVLM
jgi:hypothetical protein